MAFASAGNNKDARTPMMATTTNNSIRVNAVLPPDRTVSAIDAKYNFGELIDLARADLVTVVVIRPGRWSS